MAARLRAITLVVLAGALALPVGCSAGDEPGSSGPAEPAPEVACDDPPTRESCSSVVVDGRSIRYHVTPGAAELPTVVVDLGGPGVAVLGGAYSLGEFEAQVPDLAGRYRFLFVEEPWVRSPVSDRCDAALRDFYRQVQDLTPAADGAARTVRDDCEIDLEQRRWGFDPASYRATINQIEAVEHLDVAGFVGLSFGVTRASYLALGDYDWSVFVRPFAVGTTGTELLAARTRKSAAVVEALQPGMAVSGTDIEGATFAHASALAGLGYLPPDERARVGPGVVAGTDSEEIDSLASRVWQVYGDGTLSPAYLAYLDEVCGATSTWPSYSPGVASVANVFAAAHLPCAGGTGASTREVFGRDRTCLVVSSNDAVSPAELVTSAEGLGDDPEVVTIDEVEHQSLGGLQECLRRVAATS